MALMPQPILPDMKSTACPLWGLFAHLESASTAPLKPLLTAGASPSHHNSPFPNLASLAAASSAVLCLSSNGLPQNRHRYCSLSLTLLHFIAKSKELHSHLNIPVRDLALPPIHPLLKMDEHSMSGRFRNTICKFPFIIISITSFPILQFASQKVKNLTSHHYTSRQHRVQVTQEPLVHSPKPLWRDFHS